MYFTYFEIKNFRGIKGARIDLHKAPNAPINVLVGLNESGKTTFLEALNHFSYKTETLDPLKISGYTIPDPHTLIPRSQQGNFNGEISIEAGLKFEPTDKSELKKAIWDEMKWSLSSVLDEMTIKKVLAFKDSRHDPNGSKDIWGIQFMGLNKPRQRKPKPLIDEDWKKAVNLVKPFIPSILYFPNFLFNFPERIYLEETGKKDDDEIYTFYRLVMQDILDALNNGAELETHILLRAKSADQNDKKSLEGLLLDMGRNVTDIVFKAWHEIIHQTLGQKEVVFDCGSDDSGKHFLRLRIKDSDGHFTIGERSLGFRWFFVFLLLTQYRGFRKEAPNKVLFLFDEPASNLHPTAQAQLLRSFENLARSCRILYTTHSHHLINPEWLEQTFVVKNEGLDYETDATNYNAKKTDITVTRYRDFVSRHPDQTQYYKPILDVLDYCPSQLENVPDVVMIEGKNDFYTLKYLALLLKLPNSPNLLPGMSAGSLGTPIRLYLAWGRNFIVLLDSDSEGKAQKERYSREFGSLVANRVFSLEDVDSRLIGSGMERLFSEGERSQIQSAIYSGTKKFNKTHFNRSIQELLVRKERLELSEETLVRFHSVFEFMMAKLKAANDECGVKEVHTN